MASISDKAARAMRDEVCLFLEGGTLAPDFFERHKGVLGGPWVAFLNSNVMSPEMGQLALAKLAEEAPPGFWEKFFDEAYYVGKGHILVEATSPHRKTIEMAVKGNPGLFYLALTLSPPGHSEVRIWLESLDPNNKTS